MSYRALAQSDAVEGLGSLPPRYSGEAVIAINPGTSSNNNNGRASNYLHISDGKSITGTHHVNTDLQPLAGRFDNAEDREKTPNVYLEAKYIDVELMLSGSKKAKIIVSDPAHPAGTNRAYSRHIIRIVSARLRSRQPVFQNSHGKSHRLRAAETPLLRNTDLRYSI
jgi:hypothetical protein